MKVMKNVPLIRIAASALICIMYMLSSVESVKADVPADYVDNPTSPWNTQISTRANYTMITGNVIRNIVGGLSSWLGSTWSFPFYVADTTNVQYPATFMPVLYNQNAWYYVWTGAWKRYNNTLETEQQIINSSSNAFPYYNNKYTGNVFSSTSTRSWVLPSSYNGMINPAGGEAAAFYFAANMQPASGPDGHMAVVQPDGMVVETYATIVLSSGQIVALSYVRNDPSSLCNGYQNGQTASMLPVYAGLIDDQEVTDGVINHAMAITVPATLLTPRISYPAYAFDRDAMTSTPRYSGPLPMGSRLALPWSLNLASLGLSTPEGKTIAAAAQKYGFLIVDRGGGGITIRVRANSSEPDSAIQSWNAPLQNDLNTIFRNVRKVN